MSNPLIGFLTARLDEDQAAALAAEHWGDLMTGLASGGPLTQFGRRNDPARVLAEVQAKRAALVLLEQFDDLGWQESYAVREQAREVVKVLATVYDDHPDYLPEWKL